MNAHYAFEAGVNKLPSATLNIFSGKVIGKFDEVTAYLNLVGTLPLYKALSLQMGFGLGYQHLAVPTTVSGASIAHPKFNHFSPEFVAGIKYNINQHIFTCARLMMYTGKVKDAGLLDSTAPDGKAAGGVIFTRPILINWSLGYLF